MWLCQQPLAGDDLLIAGGQPFWSQVLEAEKQHFSTDSPCRNAGRLPSAAGPVRCIFPISPLSVHMPEQEAFHKETFAGSLRLVTGHVYVYAWFVAMYRALSDETDADVARLWQAALTVTLHARSGLSVAELAIWSNEAPWTTTEAQNALKTAGMYEAGGSLMWRAMTS